MRFDIGRNGLRLGILLERGISTFELLFSSRSVISVQVAARALGILLVHLMPERDDSVILRLTLRGNGMSVESND